MPTKAETARRLAREARVTARQAHEQGATGTKITLEMVEGIANQLIHDGQLDANDADPRTVRRAHRIAVESCYEYCERHLINLFDVPALRLIASDRIDLIAAEHGWTAHDDGVERVYRKKGRGYVRVYFDTSGRVFSATTQARRLVGRYDRRKVDSVIDYLCTQNGV